jgi:hypothetical protein
MTPFQGKGCHIISTLGTSSQRLAFELLRERQENSMSDKPKGSCAHPACRCIVPDGQKYCSQYCSDAGDTMEISCNCEHPGCSLAESV